MRVCYFGTYRQRYPRNQILIEGLRLNGVEVIECHEKLWFGTEDRVKISTGGWMTPKFLFRVSRTYFRLLIKYFHIQDHDVIMVGYPGHFDIYLARILSYFRGKPLAWDVLNSLYLIASERGLTKSNPYTINLIKKIEKIACRLPDMLFLDTKEFVNWFKVIHNVNPSKFKIIPIGADDRYFIYKETQKTNNVFFKIIYYGTYIPNHGVEYIVKAARILHNDPSIQFEMIGRGPDLDFAMELANKLKLTNITFIPWQEQEELMQHIANSDLVLGVFGTTKQVTLTNNNKIYEGFALKKPVISGKSPALPQELKHKIHIYLCERGSPESLADAILTLKSQTQLFDKLAANGYKIFHQHFNIKSIGKTLSSELSTLSRRENKLK